MLGPQSGNAANNNPNPYPSESVRQAFIKNKRLYPNNMSDVSNTIHLFSACLYINQTTSPIIIWARKVNK